MTIVRPVRTNARALNKQGVRDLNGRRPAPKPAPTEAQRDIATVSGTTSVIGELKRGLCAIERSISTLETMVERFGTYTVFSPALAELRIARAKCETCITRLQEIA